MSRKLFTAGCFVLIALGLVHLLGHYRLMTGQGDNEQERQLLTMMRSNPQDMGLGTMRTMFDIVAGFSLYFSLSAIGLGLLGLGVRRHAGTGPLLRQAAIVYAGTFGIITGVAIRYWFPAPLAFIAAAFLCFTAAVATAPRGA
jgi:hypothetical protein